VVVLAVLAKGDLLGPAGVKLAVPTAPVVTVLREELYVRPLSAAPSFSTAELLERKELTTA
jgi:predicted PurR-regulated permease PerM